VSLLAPAGAVLAPPRGRRVCQLLSGLVLYGVSDAMMLRAGLGVDPWDVLHQGLSRRLGLAVGTWAVIVGLAVLLLWIPLRQRPGLGTVLNVIVIGVVIDLVMATFGPADGVAWRATVLASGVAVNGVATATYIGAGLGPGPRDGLMTGIAARGPSIRLTRTTIEVTVLATGWLLGGTVGLGTVLYAVSIGPVTQWLLPWTTVGAGPAPAARARPSDELAVFVGRRLDEDQTSPSR
jgi:uncharacterized membrane protein YczE